MAAAAAQKLPIISQKEAEEDIRKDEEHKQLILEKEEELRERERELVDLRQEHQSLRDRPREWRDRNRLREDILQKSVERGKLWTEIQKMKRYCVVSGDVHEDETILIDREEKKTIHKCKYCGREIVIPAVVVGLGGPVEREHLDYQEAVRRSNRVAAMARQHHEYMTHGLPSTVEDDVGLADLARRLVHSTNVQGRRYLARRALEARTNGGRRATRCGDEFSLGRYFGRRKKRRKRKTKKRKSRFKKRKTKRRKRKRRKTKRKFR